MSKIKILSQKTVNMIAAGEVVDRPSSVVKELVENSIDAAAKNISVETKGDGRELIRVADDGIGMPEEDAVLAFERHATSKIESADDLDRIRTMGFRGEALPSIASVAEVEMLTRTEGSDVATRVVARAGKIDEVSKATRDVGTTVKVSNLFFNTPARARFLKSKTTEVRHVVRTFATHAMSHYWIAMKLVRDRRVALSLPAVESIEERLGGILGKGFGESSVPVNLSDEFIHLCGFLSRPEEARVTSGHMSIFVNRRPVETKLILRAICQAYGSALKRDRFPTGVVLIDIDPSEVDFNIHPTKREVRFKRERDVRDFVFRAVGSALTTRKMIPPLIARPPAPIRMRKAPDKPMSLLSTEKVLVSEPRPPYRAVPRQSATEVDREVSAIVQMKDAYILAESDAEFYLIDQHAAHERVLYEEVKSHLEGAEPVVQKLLFPETVEVTPEEEDVMDEHLDALRKMGFDVRKFGKRTYVLEAVPALSKEGDKRTLLTDIIDEVIDTRSETHDINHILAAAFACKGAVKAGDKLADDEIRSITERLFATRMPFACPHGRPTVIRLSWEEIERRFLRR